MRKIVRNTVLAFILFGCNTIFSQCLENTTFTAFPAPNGGTYNAGETVTFCFQANWTYDILDPEFLMALEVNFGPGWDLSTLVPSGIPNNCSDIPSNTISCNGSGSWAWVNSFSNPLTGASMGNGFLFTDNNPDPDNYFGDNCATTNNSCLDDPCFTFCFSISVLPFGTCVDGIDLTVSIDPLSDGEIGTDDDINCAGDPNPTIPAVSSCCNVSAGIDNCVEFCDDPSIGLLNLNDYIDNEDLGGTWYFGGSPIGSNFFNPANDPAGTYQYVVTGIGGCSDTSTLEITIHNFLHAGNATLFEFCEDQFAFEINDLNMPEDLVGIWLDPLGNVWGGIFTPSVDLDGEYLYITASSSACPSDTAFIDISTVYYPDPGMDNTISVCSNQGTVDLFNALQGTPEIGGVWNGPGITTNGDLGTLDPSTQPGGVYTYTVANGQGNQCFESAQITVILTTQLDAGTDNNVILCSTTSNVDLLNQLGGSPDLGGTWIDQNSNIIPFGQLDPSGYPVNVPLTFDYDIGAGTCADSSVLTITFTISPEAGMTSGGMDSIFLCGPANVPFDFIFSNGNGPYSIIVEDQNSTQIIDQSGIAAGNYSENIFVNITSTFVLSTFDDTMNSCPGSINSNDTVVVVVNEPPSGTIFTFDDICLGQSAELSLNFTGTAPFSAKIQVNANPPVTYSNLSSSEIIPITPLVSGPTTFTLTEVADGNNPTCTTTLSNSIGINVYDPPTVEISGTDTICVGEQAQLELDITGAWSNYSVWLTANGSPFQFSNVNDGDMINVPASSTITYCVDSIAPVSFPSCISHDATGCIEIYLSEAPEIQSIMVTCDPLTEEGSVDFEVIDDDSNDISVSGISGSLAGLDFTSDIFPNGASFNVTAQDEFGCTSTNQFMNINCSCVPSFPGTMITSDTITTCGSLLLNANSSFNNDTILEPGDVLAFVLHDSSTNILGTIYSSNSDPTFFYTASLNFGQVYYVSPISGLNSGGSVNLNDPCLTVGAGIPIIFYPQPTADLLNNSISSCSGISADLEIFLTGGSPYTLTLEDSSGPVMGSPFTVLSSPFIYSTAVADTYTITSITNDNCAGNSTLNTATVVSNDIPTLSIDDNFIFCENGINQLEFSFTGVGPWTIDLDHNGSPQPSIIFSDIISFQDILFEGTYVFTGVSDVNCADVISDTIEVAFFENPQAIISGGGTFCDGDSSLIELQFSGGNPDYTFSYSDGITTFGPFTSTGNSFSFFENLSGEFEITEMADQYCSGTFSGVATNEIIGLPTVDLLLSQTNICDGESVTLSFDLNQTSLFNFDLVSNGDTSALQVTDGFELNLLPSDTTYFEVINIIDQESGCQSFQGGTITLNVIPIPESNAGPNVSICPGDSVNIGSSGILGASYLWTNTAGLSSPFVSGPSVSLENFNGVDIDVEYILFTTLNGCSSSDTTFVTVFDPPQVDFYYNPDPILLTEPTVNLINLSDNDLTFYWDIESIGTSTEANPTVQFSNLTPNNYEVCLYGTDANSCMSAYCSILSVSGDPIVYIPNSFTPDGDGVNDNFYPVISNAKLEQYEFSIFNRWGEIIFQANDIKTLWNGHGKNDKYFTESEVYLWVLQFKNPYNAEILNYQGHVTVIR